MTKKLLFFFFLLTGSLVTATTAQAAPGDTTRVQIFKQRALTHYGNYDTTATFPAAGRYRKILLHYVLGRYACPAGTQYCGSWDYTTRVQLLPDTMELARVITPYATDWLARSITHDYVLDVTDYATRLKGPQPLRFLYDGYSWGFTLTLYVEYIEGVPPHDALAVSKVYNGTFAYGKTADPIENHLSAKTVTPAAGASQVMLKSFITGHGSDPSGCAEFCPKAYALKVNGTQVASDYLWRDNCGLNEIYPQTGTWLYDRSNWCPGSLVAPLYHNLTLGTTGTVDFDMQPYTASNQANASAVWIWQTQLVSYGAANYTADAALDEIIAPTNNSDYARENPICDAPRIKLRNTGSTTLTSATIKYRVGTNAWRTYQWTGSLAFMAQTEVRLPPVPADFTGQSVFKVYVSLPNNQADQNHYNDTLRAKFATVPVLPAAMTVVMTTNKDYNGVSENSWNITDKDGNVVASRTGAATSTTYTNSVSLAPGCYTFTVDDTGCDGFAWWANTAAGNGTLRLLNASGGVLVNISGDFGCQYSMRFNVAQALAATTAQPLAVLDVYPNPSEDGRFTLALNLPIRQDVQLEVRTVTGQLVQATTLPQVQIASRTLDLHQLAAGVYLLECKGSAGTRFFRRLLIP
ncbi:MAG: peptide-N-glycosidase F-related protein [Janthinobacterium lividum]